MFALGLAIMSFATSCDGNASSEKQVCESAESVTPWQKSLAAIMKQPMLNGDLKLEGYSVVGKVESEQAKQEYLNKCFAPDSYFLVFNNEWENKRDLGLQSELADRSKFDASSFAFRKGYVKGSLTADIVNIVELRWSYKGKNITTYAAVTNNEANPICYDNILTPYDPIVTKTVDTRSNGSRATIVRSARPGVVKKAAN
ncbi:MAG: hypothetical protein IJD72_08425 [Alistipes sp.]|nr:hypothetical protein [Alistipes sp.]